MSSAPSSSERAATRVLVADDHEIVRKGLCYRKLQVTDRAQAVAEAIRTGLI